MSSKSYYETVGRKVLRCGYTTGSCAAAASAGALESLLVKKPLVASTITLPEGERVEFELVDVEVGETARAGVIKDAGDDYDITDGIKVFSEIGFKDTPGIEIHGGSGVGVVTKSGLDVDIGEAAINPVPREMIKRSVETVLNRYGYDSKENGLIITISIPEGEKLAEKTFNPRLGIKGGLSVLGTTGIVKPMSVEALIKTTRLELAQKKSKTLAFVFGNYGKTFSEALGVNETKLVTVSNYIGEILDEAVVRGVKNILIVGDMGKLVKLAGGIFRTHSKESDARMEILAANLALLGADREVISEILSSPTTSAAIKVIEENGFEKLYQSLVEKIKKRTQTRVLEELNVEVILFSRGKGELARTEGAERLLEELR